MQFCRAMFLAARKAVGRVPLTACHMRAKLREAKQFANGVGKPIWLAEWQRTREELPDVMRPHHSSLSRVVREGRIDGDFLWGLMLEPAYMEKPHEQGRVNGVFYEDGVPSLRMTRGRSRDRTGNTATRRSAMPY